LESRRTRAGVEKSMRDTKNRVVSTSLNHPHRCLSEVEGKEAERRRSFKNKSLISIFKSLSCD
ncbi:MAG: hypothetical protein LWX70_06720, partial [Sphingobacteriia bacterium]|nr:hypothetical protein [Sphingobacteriia bacterium]